MSANLCDQRRTCLGLAIIDGQATRTLRNTFTFSSTHPRRHPVAREKAFQLKKFTLLHFYALTFTLLRVKLLSRPFYCRSLPPNEEKYTPSLLNQILHRRITVKIKLCPHQWTIKHKKFTTVLYFAAYDSFRKIVVSW